MTEVIIPKTKEEKRQEMLDEWEKQRIRAKSKKWYQENKEQKMEYCKEYYQTNKKLINAKLSEKVECDHCGCVVSKRRLLDHKRTLKCKTLSEKKNEIL